MFRFAIEQRQDVIADILNLR